MCCLDSDEPFPGMTGASGCLCAGELSALPLAAATSGKAPSGMGFLWLPAGYRLQLEQTIKENWEH